MSRGLALDLRDLEAPEPFARAMEAAARLGEGEHLLLIHWREPYPLYRTLLAHGYAYSVSRIGDDFEIRVWRSQMPGSLSSADR